MTGNVPLFAQTNVIVINAGAHEQLDKEQRSILAKAADEVRASTIASTPEDAAQARAYCESEPGSGRVVALASDADVAALKAATAPVYAELERDALTRRVIERVRQRKRSGSVSPTPAACGESAATLANAKATSALDGKYRFEVTDEELRVDGAPEADVIENRGVWTWTLAGGEYCWEQKAPTPISGNPDVVPGNAAPTESRGIASSSGSPGARTPFGAGAGRRAATFDFGGDGRRNGQRRRARPGLRPLEADRRLMRLATLALLLATPALAGCFDGGSATKAGGAAGPVTLPLATDDTEGYPSVDQSREFARRVDALSNGQLRIEPVMDSVKPQPDYERLVARLVTSGELDMGLMPAQYFDLVGVTSLRALDAPFLVTSDALLAQVVADDVAKEMLSGLERVGVVGLGLLPVGLDHPAGLNGPLLGPEDYQGGLMPGTRAKTRNEVVRSLGASFVQGVVPDRSQHVGGVGAYGFTPGGTFTGNVTLSAWADAIVINARVYEQLDERQRSILATAADQTREWAIA